MNWLGDSKPKFPAKISEILYARFYANPILSTVSAYSRLITLHPCELGGGLRAAIKLRIRQWVVPSETGQKAPAPDRRKKLGASRCVMTRWLRTYEDRVIGVPGTRVQINSSLGTGRLQCHSSDIPHSSTTFEAMLERPKSGVANY
jgi:hypothetical protein